jgi:hypothetical protein
MLERSVHESNASAIVTTSWSSSSAEGHALLQISMLPKECYVTVNIKVKFAEVVYF